MTSLADTLSLPALPQDLVAFEHRLVVATAEANSEITEPALRVVRGGGKRLRPIMTIAAASAGGSAVTDKVLQAAVAVELVHVGSLVHDDIIDRAPTRRGVPTVNAAEGDNHAILVGDFLLSRAGKESALISQRAAITLADTIIDLCVGQSLETAALDNLARTEDQVFQAMSGKTAALLRASCSMGAIAAELSDDVTNALAEYGFAFGLAFQLVDDVLDISSTAEHLGKPVANDISEGNFTLPVVLALQSDHDRQLHRALQHRRDPEAVALAVELVRLSGALQATMERVRAYNERAASVLDRLPPSAIRDDLQALPAAYAQWAVTNVSDEFRDLVVA